MRPEANTPPEPDRDQVLDDLAGATAVAVTEAAKAPLAYAKEKAMTAARSTLSLDMAQNNRIRELAAAQAETSRRVNDILQALGIVRAQLEDLADDVVQLLGDGGEGGAA